jgi:hypothetical protein
MPVYFYPCEYDAVGRTSNRSPLPERVRTGSRQLKVETNYRWRDERIRG